MSIKMKNVCKEIHYAMATVTVEGNCLMIEVSYIDNKFANKVLHRIIDVANKGV